MRAQARSMVAPSLAEPGCLSYRNYVDPDDPRAWVVLEEVGVEGGVRGAPGQPAPGPLPGADGRTARRPARGEGADRSRLSCAGVSCAGVSCAGVSCAAARPRRVRALRGGAGRGRGQTSSGLVKAGPV
nr:antibiotic biosynthesis monooxygenase [Streptomyces sp. CB01881]